jgi:hypothetical protein
MPLMSEFAGPGSGVLAWSVTQARMNVFVEGM